MVLISDDGAANLFGGVIGFGSGVALFVSSRTGSGAFWADSMSLRLQEKLANDKSIMAITPYSLKLS